MDGPGSSAMSFRAAPVLLMFALLTGCINHRGPAGKPVVRLAVIRGSFLFVPVHLAKTLGFYEQEGVAVSLDEVVSSSREMESLIGGTSDVAAGGFMSVVT